MKTLRSKRHRISRSVGGDFLVLSALVVLGCFIALPFYFSIIQSLKPMDELFVFPPRLWVVRPTLENYVVLSQLAGSLWVPFSRYLYNSLFITVTGTVGHVVFASMAGFILAKYRLPGLKLLFSLVIVSLLFTYEVTFLPSYVLMARTGLLNTTWALVLPALSAPLGLFLMKQFMEVVPDAMIEAARVDGASTWQTYARVVMPQVRPAWLTLTIFSFQALWNRQGLEFIYDEELKTLPTVLSQITASGIARAGAAAAVGVVLMLPPILIFVLSQSNIIETMSHSGIKE
jgi:putative chitobiose transport system permease protein